MALPGQGGDRLAGRHVAHLPDEGDPAADRSVVPGQRGDDDAAARWVAE